MTSIEDQSGLPDESQTRSGGRRPSGAYHKWGKRSVDVLISLAGLVILGPLILPVMLIVWAQDRHSPLYVASRTGLNSRPFQMIKMRSMIVNADATGVDSTGADDARITRVGRFIRRTKLDEVTQLWNVLRGDMSLVGPRPNVERETRLYTQVERRLLSVRPGITDLASVVFADEAEILEGQSDPDIAYNQLIRPIKSRLGLFAVDHQSLGFDFRCLWITIVSTVSRQRALREICALLESCGGSHDLVTAAKRSEPLVPLPPPGSDSIVTRRDHST